MPKTRLDQLLVSRGLAQSRERARAMILAGDVSVGGLSTVKAGTMVDEAATLSLRQADHPWVGRGGIKLAHALDAFGLDAAGRLALDIGASTGGFTDVLLDRGARKVIALDVGHGQLDWRLRNDQRVEVLEGVNARHLRPEDLPDDARAFDIITIDVSFISLKHVFPVLPALLRPDGRVVALLKPQFEARREDVGKGGIIRDPAIHERVIAERTREAHQIGLERVALEPSPIEGAEGNREFFLLLAPMAKATHA